jgi:hypothetical protein
MQRSGRNPALQLRARHDSYDAILYSMESHPFIDAASQMIVGHDVQEWNFVTRELDSNQHFDKPARQAATLEVRVRADAAAQ